MTRRSTGIGAVLMVAGAVLTFGFIGFGPGMILVGILLVLGGRWRTRPTRLLAISVSASAGILGWYMMIPLSCSATSVSADQGNGIGAMACTSLLGWTSPGPSWAVLVGAVVGLAVLVLAVRQLTAKSVVVHTGT